jgi:Holliday junction resolvase RusA-like endonuclease
MNYIQLKIFGIPYGKVKTRGNKDAPEKWTQNVIEKTKHLPKVKEACILKVTFLLPPNKFPKDFPYGPDLDNLTKRFNDALNETIFSETEGKDSCVIELNVMKTRVEKESEAGAYIEVLPVKIK